MHNLNFCNFCVYVLQHFHDSSSFVGFIVVRMKENLVMYFTSDLNMVFLEFSFSALTLLVRHQEEHAACKIK